MFMSTCFIRTLSGDGNTINFMCPNPVSYWVWVDMVLMKRTQGKNEGWSFHQLGGGNRWILKSGATWKHVKQHKL